MPGIRDAGLLRAFEYEQAADRAAELVDKPITGSVETLELIRYLTSSGVVQ